MKLYIIFLGFVCAIGVLVIISRIKDFIDEAKKSPTGKKFIKNFASQIEDIQHNQIYNGDKNLEVSLNNKIFKVCVTNDPTIDTLSGSFLSVYKSKSVYIDDELVCRLHIWRPGILDEIFIDFSRKRSQGEIIEIISEAARIAEHARKERCLENYKSFYN